MSRRRPTPETSKIARPHTLAYARKQRPGDSDDDDGVKDEPKADPKADAKASQKTDAKDTAKPEPAKANPPEDEPFRGHADTISMPMEMVIGAPPDVPTMIAPLETPGVEEPAHMPGPRDVPAGDPDDLAPPPGHVPPGDSRSLRKRSDRYEFALVYRQGNAVISRWGTVGTRGQWRVVEYPTTASASHAYAKECSRFVSEGFSDYRD